MQVSQKSQYALRAIFELAKRRGQGPVKIAEIAKAQAIPERFLEAILSQLKQARFVESHRGSEGGYVLVRSPEDLTVGEVMEFVQGPVGPIACLIAKSEASKCSLHGHCIFRGMWEKLQHAISNVYNSTTFHDLVTQEAERVEPCIESPSECPGAAVRDDGTDASGYRRPSQHDSVLGQSGQR